MSVLASSEGQNKKYSSFIACHITSLQLICCHISKSKQRGRPKTSIVTTLRRDLKSHNNDHWPTRLQSINDLDHLRDIAQNRSDWKHLTTAIYSSAKAETSVDVAADGH
ncbi:hypothetical protein ElyMa_001618600 [Elysia marginata]|uniref:Uncharacterized protein n=1 Tax=Elysia marginata TaxID=1093978 RepID=A0AAV4JJW1_9GAST|nr:hypothetical protein ElyMa_001618600 [Elysia marginata]